MINPEHAQNFCIKQSFSVNGYKHDNGRQISRKQNLYLSSHFQITFLSSMITAAVAAAAAMTIMSFTAGFSCVYVSHRCLTLTTKVCRDGSLRQESMFYLFHPQSLLSIELSELHIK
jgi:hypothetical protein